MSDFRRGDIVSLSRAQSSLVSVLSAPAAPGELYTATLQINGAPKDFTFVGQPGQTTADVAEGLLLVLLNDQTVYSAAIGVSPSTIVLVGALGLTFPVATTANMSPSVVEAAVQAVHGHTGLPIGLVRLIETTDTLEKLREVWTRDRLGQLTYMNVLKGRELDSGEVFEFLASQVLTVVHTEGR